MRRWFVAAAFALLAVVLGFYGYSKYRAYSAIKHIPEKLGVEVQQSTSGFTFSKSEGGMTLFTISAGKAVQFKQGQRAQLNDVRIVVFTRQEGSYDQIYGKRFAYDPQSGEVRAEGDVMIDLGVKGRPETEVAQTAPGAIHLKTSGLSFNRQTGIARTEQRIEFSIPQANGSAQGAVYDSRSSSLTLQSDVRVHAQAGAAAGAATKPADITAASAVISDKPRTTLLEHVHMEQPGRKLDAERIRIVLDLDNRVRSATASGGIQMSSAGATRTAVRASSADLSFGDDNSLDSALLSGGVSISATGQSPMQGRADKVRVDFAAKGRLKDLHAQGAVQISRTLNAGGRNAQSTEVLAPAVDFKIGSGNRITRATTAGASQIILASASGRSSRTVISAGDFDVAFGAGNRPQQIHGEPDARVVTSTPGEADRITTSRRIDVRFRPGTSEIAGIVQSGGFTYKEGARSGTAESASYLPQQESIELKGMPRVEDSGIHFSISAEEIRLNRKTGDAIAQGSVKTTYSEMTPSPQGAMLAASDPIHVTAQRAVARRASESARFSGGARLWQGANIVEAPVIVFDRSKRSLEALSNSNQHEVRTVFVKNGKDGKQVPVNVAAARLTYSDQQRIARFLGGVQVISPEATLHADQIEIALLPKGEKPANSATSASTVRQITASGNVVVEQRDPVRKAVGDRLMYLADGEKFVLTGSLPNSASIFDAEHGKISGDSLTFYTRDDRVQVVSRDSTRTVTRTRSQDER